jgi:TolB protein
MLFSDNENTMLALSSENVEASKVKLLVGIIGSVNNHHQKIIDDVVHHLSCSAQKQSGFDVSIDSYPTLPSNKGMKNIFNQGYPLVLFIAQRKDNALEWRLYDVTQIAMMAGKRVTTSDCTVHECAEHISSSAWKALLYDSSLFGTSIAYCKERNLKDGKKARSICMQSACGMDNEKIQIDTPTMKIGLRWHPDAEKRQLYFSECTASNVRLMSVGAHKNQAMVANFDGLTMEPSISADGTKMAMSASVHGVSQIFYGQRKSTQDPWSFRRLTKNNGNNISPVFLENGDLVFCSDYEDGRPHIYKYVIATNECTRITSGLSSTSPAVCFLNNKLAYSKVVDGYFQIFTYDLKTGTHTQITHDKSDKEESSWSPCGNYLAFSHDTGKSSRIAIMNMITKERWYLTSSSDRCMHPAWSPRIMA